MRYKDLIVGNKVRPDRDERTRRRHRHKHDELYTVDTKSLNDDTSSKLEVRNDRV